MIDHRISTAIQLLAEVLAEQQQVTAEQTAPEALLSTDQLAARLRCHPHTVRARMRAGMPYVRVGRMFRFDLEQVRAWLATREENQEQPKTVETKPVTPKPTPVEDFSDLGLGDDVAENPFAD